MLRLERITKRFGRAGREVVAVDELSLSVPAGAFLTLLGPSGCGKTTTLRCVAGLERIDGGTIELAAAVVSDPDRGVHVPPDRRAVGMVFQSPTVWPHMTVLENVTFPLRSAPRADRISRGDAAARAADALARVQLDGLEGRPATDLSGGQQQRLALARALARAPRLLLLDEPLSALDTALREEVGLELRRIQAELGLTTVYVTHDQGEALALSTHLAVVRAGRIDQVGTPRALYERPATAFVARALGHANLVPGRVRETAGGFALVDTEHGLLRVSSSGARLATGRSVVVVARPEHVRLEPDAGAPRRVTGTSFLRDAVDVVLGEGEGRLRARVPVACAPEPGSAVRVVLHEPGLVLLPGDDGAR